jgi:hypothetical protein
LGGKHLPTGKKTSRGKALPLKGKQLTADQQKRANTAARKEAAKRDAANRRKNALPKKNKKIYKNGEREH